MRNICITNNGQAPPHTVIDKINAIKVGSVYQTNTKLNALCGPAAYDTRGMCVFPYVRT